MIKFFIKVNIVFCFLISSFAQATLITTPLVAETDTTQGNYITYQGIDIAWASNVNSEKWYNSLVEINILRAPGTHTGWGFATTEQWDMITALAGSDLLALFTRTDGTLIQAFEYWNTVFYGDLDTTNVLAGEISSNWSWSDPDTNVPKTILSEAEKIAQFEEIDLITSTIYDTFYFRQTATTPVPEPSTLMIFALGLITLASKKRLFS